MLQYVLDDGGNPIPEPDLRKWGTWMQTADRRIALTKLNDNIKVSTVFLGLDHNFDDEGPPILYETMIFDGNRDQYTKRYPTKEEALEGHAKAVVLAELNEATKGV